MLDNLSEMLKGILEGLVLEIISREEIYGYLIVKQLKELDFADLAEATVYALLLRLEKNRLVNVVRRPSDLGPPRKFYTLNFRGREQLSFFRKQCDFLSKRVNYLQKGGKIDEFK